MPTLPIILSPGMVAIYGIGDFQKPMPSGAILETGYRFGTIYNIWDGGATYIYGGDVVFWKDGDEQTRLATAGGIYTILPARLVTQDIPPPP